MPFDQTKPSDAWSRHFRYRGERGREQTIGDSFRRVADALAGPEREDERDAWSRRFLGALTGFYFVPSEQVLALAGTAWRPPLMSSFIVGEIPDDTKGLYQGLCDTAVALEHGGAAWVDMSSVSPGTGPADTPGERRRSLAQRVGLWDATASTLKYLGDGAVRLSLRIDHPDILDFLAVGEGSGIERTILISDDFMRTLARDGTWTLAFAGKTKASLPAARLWRAVITELATKNDVRLVFIDRWNGAGNLAAWEPGFAAHPSGDLTLPSSRSRPEGHLNLAGIVADHGNLPVAVLEDTVECAVRMLDNALDVSGYATKAMQRDAIAVRSLSLGIEGLDDALLACGLDYDSKAGRRRAAEWFQLISQTAYRVSCGLAEYKGRFGGYDARLVSSPIIGSLPQDLRDRIRSVGLRNAGLLSIRASAFAQQMCGTGAAAVARRPRNGDPGTGLARTRSEILMQAVVQGQVDDLVDCPIYRPGAGDLPAFEHLCQDAYDLGLKTLSLVPVASGRS